MSNVVSINKPALPPGFAKGPAKAWRGFDMETGDEGVEGGGFGRISYKQGKWKLHLNKKEHAFVFGKEAGPAAGKPIDALCGVFLRVATVKEKRFYKGGYVEGSHERPTCWSNDGIRPDPEVPPSQKMCDNCSECPANQWGSRAALLGGTGRGKACSDAKRAAFYVAPNMKLDPPLDAPLTEPVLLRIPAASLQTFGDFASGMRDINYPLASFVTKVSFDPNVAYQKLVFEAVEQLDDAETAVSQELRDSSLAKRIVNESDIRPLASPPATGASTGGGGQANGAAKVLESTSVAPKAIEGIVEKKQDTAAVKSDADFDARISDLMNK